MTGNVSSKKIWVIAGRDGYEVGDETYEVLTEANSLDQEKDFVISVFLFGLNLDQAASSLEQRGLSDYIYVFESPEVKSYNPHIYLQILQAMHHEQSPFLILIAATSMGKDLGPRLAYHLDGGYISNVQQIKLNSSREIEAIKPIYGGKVHANFRFIGFPPWIATIIPGVVGFEKVKKVNRKTQVIHVTDADKYVQKLPDRYRVIDFVKADPGTMDISEADIIVAGGRGVNRAKGFQLLKELADQIGGVTGCTRPIVDENILPFEKQVGQTGKTVSPNLFISCGISGAIQHEMGMKDSKRIIAINTDSQAQVLQIADLKVIGDVNEIFPLLIEKIRKHRERLVT